MRLLLFHGVVFRGVVFRGEPVGSPRPETCGGDRSSSASASASTR
jgi:hypothetical protein